MSAATVLIRIAASLTAAAFVSAAQDPCGAEVSKLVRGSVDQRLRRVTEIHARGKEAIPRLISEIDKAGTAAISLANPFLSNVPFVSPYSCGSAAAYMVELILGRPKLSLRTLGGGFLIEGDPWNYVYPSGHIVDDRGKPITIRELKKVRKIYEQWWKRNAERPLEQLRTDWSQYRRPLSGSGYTWR